MSKVKNYVLSMLLAVGIFSPALIPATVYAQTQINQNLCRGADINFEENAECETEDGSSVNTLVETIINILSLVVGVVAVIMIIIAGLRYITSGGDSGNVGNAKNTILYAIVGLVIVALAQIIVRFVLGRAAPAE